MTTGTPPRFQLILAETPTAGRCRIRMAGAVEVVARMGDTVLDVAYVVDSRYGHAGEWIDVGAEHGTLRRGLVEISFARVERPTRNVPLVPHGDRRALSYIAVSLAVHLVVWAVAPPPPEPQIAARVDVRPALRLRRFALPPPAPPAWELGASHAFASNGAGSPAPGPAGATGGRSSSVRGRIQIAERHPEPQVSRASASERGRHAGIFASQQISHGFDAVVGRADLSSGFDRTDVRGPVYGGEGAGRGSFGLARRGSGEGGGCAGGECGGIVGTGRYGTLNGSGFGWGGGRGGMSSRSAQVPTVILCGGPRPCVVIGGLDKTIIRRYIRRELSKVTYCYERELLADDRLDGTVMTDFLIAKDGTVQASEASGVSQVVASCVAGVMKNIKFPRSAAGGATRVTYPFTFRPTGS